jgi:hypothetical protein
VDFDVATTTTIKGSIVQLYMVKLDWIIWMRGRETMNFDDKNQRHGAFGKGKDFGRRNRILKRGQDTRKTMIWK